jgi:hypothetical protein
MPRAKRPDSTPPEQRPEIGPLWTYYRVTFRFLTKLCGSVPANPEIVKKWLEAREPEVRPAGSLSIEEINEEVLASIQRGEGEPSQEYALLTFQRNAGVIVMRAATVRAHTKDCARVLSAQFIGYFRGERSFATRVVNGVYHDEQQYWLPVRRPDGSLITMVDGAYDKAIHTRGPDGRPINALKRIEFIAPPAELSFTLKVLGRSVSETDLAHIYTYGGTHGYGGERSDGEGRYLFDLERLDGPPAYEAVHAEPQRSPAANGRGDHREV